MTAAIASCERPERRANEPEAPGDSNGARVRSAVDTDPHHLGALAAELAAADACDRLRGQFRGLRAAAEPVATGTLWIRDCVPAVRGTTATFAIGGEAWQWAAPSPAATGISRAGVTAQVTGAIAVEYEPRSRRVTIRFAPVSRARVVVIPRGGSPRGDGPFEDAIRGAIGTALATPARAPALADPGVDPFAGVAVVIDLCMPLPAFTFDGATPGSPRPDTPIALEAGGLAMFGPHDARHGLEIHGTADRGTVELSAVCAHDARRIAEAYVADRAAAPARPLAVRSLSGATAQLRVAQTECPVVLVGRARAPASFRWFRLAAATEGAVDAPAVRCEPAEVEPRLAPAR